MAGAYVPSQYRNGKLRKKRRPGKRVPIKNDRRNVHTPPDQRKNAIVSQVGNTKIIRKDICKPAYTHGARILYEVIMKTLSIFIGIVFIGLIGAGLWYIVPIATAHSERVQWEQTQKLCWDYANRSHEKEFYPDRWVKVVEPMGWTTQMWYDACIENIKHPVAK